jgi:hypothetical protein
LFENRNKDEEDGPSDGLMMSYSSSIHGSLEVSIDPPSLLPAS